MINLIYENGEFRFEKAFEPVSPQTMDVFLAVKDVVPDTQQPDLTQQACLFINKKLGTETPELLKALAFLKRVFK